MDIELNKKNAIAFYKMAYEGDPKRAVELYVGNEYIQHNSEVVDGKKGFIEYFTRMHIEYKDKTIRFIRSVAEKDLVALLFWQMMKNLSLWIFLDLIMRVKLLNIGTQYKKLSQTQQYHVIDFNLFLIKNLNIV